MKNTILIVGTSFHTLRNYITEHDMEYVTLRDLKLAKNPEKKLKRRVVCDFSSEKSIRDALVELRRRFKVDGVLTTYENYVTPAAFIAKELKLPGLPLRAAEACTDKEIMRELFSRAPKKISPDYKVVTCLEDLLNFAQNHSYPLILKPANLAKSLLVTKNHNESELIKNYNNSIAMIDDVYNTYAPNRIPKILIEEFMEGSIHSVDAFVDSAGVPHVLDQVVDYQTGFDIGYNDNFHYSRILPSTLSAIEIEQLKDTAKIGCEALGMKNTPAHIEIIRTDIGPMIVEIGARNGGYRERMHSLANGIDITKNAINLALNEKLDLKATKNDYCAVLELFPKNPGIFIGIDNEELLHNLSSLEYFAVKQNIGSFVGKSSDGYKMCAIIILTNKNKSQFIQDLEIVTNKILINTR